jgi:hypothetical protein
MEKIENIEKKANEKIIEPEIKLEPELDLRALIEKNISLNEEVLERVKYIRSYVHWQKIWAVAKVTLFIVVPIILGYIYLPPLIQEISNFYGGILGGVKKN